MSHDVDFDEEHGLEVGQETTDKSAARVFYQRMVESDNSFSKKVVASNLAKITF